MLPSRQVFIGINQQAAKHRKHKAGAASPLRRLIPGIE
jgi:hypothetical protein